MGKAPSGEQEKGCLPCIYVCVRVCASHACTHGNVSNVARAIRLRAHSKSNGENSNVYIFMKPCSKLIVQRVDPTPRATISPCLEGPQRKSTCQTARS